MTQKTTINSQSSNLDASEPELHELKKNATKGAYLTILNYGLSQALRFGGNLILTHLLFPDLLGLMSLVNVIIMGLA